MKYTVKKEGNKEILTSEDGSIKEIWINGKFIIGSRLRRTNESTRPTQT